MHIPEGYVTLLVPESRKASAANMLPGYWYDLEGLKAFDEVRVGDRIRVKDKDAIDHHKRWGVVVSFGAQPLGNHYVVLLDDDPETHTVFVPEGRYDRISRKLDEGIYDDEVRVRHE